MELHYMGSYPMFDKVRTSSKQTDTDILLKGCPVAWWGIIV